MIILFQVIERIGIIFPGLWELSDKKLKKKEIPFSIDHLDPMGQGVSKITDKVTFIPKVLPGEKGICQITAEKKNIQFAQLVRIENQSELRIEPPCPHYHQCQSCHYLHTDYENEQELKFNSFRFELKKLTFLKSSKLIGSETRFGYRNRIQLHYDLNKKSLGFIDRQNNRIIPVEGCLLPTESIQKVVKELYKSNFNSFPTNKMKGHVEIYHLTGSDEVQIAYNKPYAHLGFTQVNESMNLLAHHEIKSFMDQHLSSPDVILDLFGGQGNLSRPLVNSMESSQLCIVADLFKKLPKNPHQKFLNLDLFKKNSEFELQKMTGDKAVNLMIIDPPRSGFKNISEYVNLFKPKFIIYMSCKVATLARDLSQIEQDYLLHQAIMLDFFPGSYHYEGLVFAERK